MSDHNDNAITTLPVLPVKRTVLFPGVRVPLSVGRDHSVAAVEFAWKTEDKTILVVAQRDPDTAEPTLEELHHIGTKAVIKQMGRSADGQLHAVVEGVDRLGCARRTKARSQGSARLGPALFRFRRNQRTSPRRSDLVDQIHR